MTDHAATPPDPPRNEWAEAQARLDQLWADLAAEARAEAEVELRAAITGEPPPG